MPSVGFVPTISVLERAKTVRALDRAATAIGNFISMKMFLRHAAFEIRTAEGNETQPYSYFLLSAGQPSERILCVRKGDYITADGLVQQPITWTHWAAPNHRAVCRGWGPQLAEEGQVLYNGSTNPLT
jgi:hypothetical protein